jgi:hypothetical protein
MDQDLRQASRVRRGDAAPAAVAVPAVQAVRRIEAPISYWLDVPRDPHEFVRVRTLWVTITLSLFVHLIAMVLVVERTRLLAPFDVGPKEQANEQLQVRLTAPPRPQIPPPAAEPQREIIAMPKPAHPPRPPAPREAPPVIAMTTPARNAPAPTPPAPPTPAPPRPPAESDLSSYLQARRRERGESTAPPVEAAPKSDPNANIAANLPRGATGVATPDPSKGGGIFEIKSLNYDDASFLFFGWNKDMGRRTPQLIEVRKGDNPDMEIAVVRKMISIIREYSKEDFTWRSHDREVVLSARLADNAALESFLMHDFGWDHPGRPR